MSCQLYRYLCVSTVLLLAGCHFLAGDLPPFREELREASLTTEVELLYGAWELTRTNSISPSGRSHTSMADESEDIYRIEIDADSMYRYVNSSLEWTSAYTLQSLGQTPGMFNFESQSPDLQFGVAEEKLVLSTAHVNGTEEVFRRLD